MTTDIGKVFPTTLSEQGLVDGGANPVKGSTLYRLCLGGYIGVYEPVLIGKPDESDKPKDYVLRSVLDSNGKMVALDKPSS